MSERVQLPPGPRGLPWLGSLPAMMRDPIKMYLELGLSHGDVSHLFLGPASLYMVNDSDMIEQVLLGEHQSCIKDEITRHLIPLLGYGLLTNEGAAWRRQRKLASPPLQPKRVAEYADLMVSAAARTFDAFRPGEQRDLHVDMMALTLEIVSATLLGVSAEGETARIAAVLEAAQHFLESRLYSLSRLLPISVPTPASLRFRRSVRELDRIVYQMIARCRAEGGAADHLLARLMSARTEDGEAMSDEQLRDEVVTMMLAGHETTALLMMYAVYVLATHAHEAGRLRAEVDDKLKGRAATFADLPNLPYLDAFVRETLRLYPPVYAFGREIVTPFAVGGYTLTKGSTVLFSPFARQRNPKVYPEPERFQPERWLSSAPGSSDLRVTTPPGLRRFDYFPFGGGPRVCIGNHFATMEAALLLATLVQKVELSIDPAFQLVLAPAITLRIKHGLRAKVERRRD
jgi:cytochrome P450